MCIWNQNSRKTEAQHDKDFKYTFVSICQWDMDFTVTSDASESLPKATKQDNTFPIIFQSLFQ